MSRPQLKGLAVAGATVVLGVGSGFAFLEGRNRDDRTWRYWERRLPQEIEAARAAGIWTSAEEIDEPVQSDKAGRELAAIWGEIEAAGLKNHQYAGWFHMYCAGGKSRDEALLQIEEVKPFIPRIYELVEKESFAWPASAPGAVDRLTEGGRANSLTLNVARVEARKGNFAEIERAFRAHVRMSDFMLRSGHIRGVAQGMSARRTLAEALMALAVDPQVAPEQVERLAALITMPEIEWQHALRYMGMMPGKFQPISSREKPKWKASDAGEWAKAMDWETFWRAPVSDVERAAQSRQLHSLVQAWPFLDQGEHRVAQLIANPPPRTNPPEPSWPVTLLHMYPVPNYVVLIMDNRGQLAAKVTAARLFAEQRRTGRLPAKLGSEMPADPWTGRPLRYEVAGNEFFLWSAGRHGTATRMTARSRLFDSAQTRRNQLAMMAPRP